LAPSSYHTPSGSESTPEIGRFNISSTQNQLDNYDDELPPPPIPLNEDNESSAANTPIEAINDLDEFMPPPPLAFGDDSPKSSYAPASQDIPPENQEDDAVSSTTPIEREWHPNTVKVAQLLRDALTDKNQSISLNALTAEADKTTTVGIFVELLHLKSWDFIQLTQNKPRADITISPASYFHDPIPDN